MAKFQVRARTVDMLGRQQIAGLPTAISELFKNAHDAYADNVEVDYFRDDGLFVLRDDGLGMSRVDFEQRWLTLGTESKVGASVGLALPPTDPNQEVRPILGEKGIGRLAIAIIGDQVLVLTRAREAGKPSKVTVGAYLHWGLFALPGLDLQDILIPVREFPGGHLPDAEEVREMVEEAVSALDELTGKTESKLIDKIREEMTAFDVDPSDCNTYLKEPSLAGNGCGTHFYIKPADSIIQDDIDNRQEDRKATRFEQHLLGFTNTMTPGHNRPSIIARFRDYVDEGVPNELIGEKAFFTPEEYQEVDHHVTGRFDEYGQFQGNVGIYQGEPEEYVLSWLESDGAPTLCGPFSLSFAYMHGQAKDSLVPPEEHARLARKLDRHGGMYVYRDGIRVQPYGDSDFDWLDIERRRTLSASYYFYSYRRMSGVIELSREWNEALSEKAGREGFRENKAYRQFRSILMNFFLQTAGDFFREEGKYADSWSEKKEELNRNEEIRRKKAKQVTVKRKKLQSDLESVFDAFDESSPEATVQKSLEKVKREVEKILSKDLPKTQKAAALMRIEKKGRDAVRECRKGLIVIKPRGVGLSRKLTNEWSAYTAEFDRLDKEVFSPLEYEIEQYVSASAIKEKVPLDDVARIDAAVRHTSDEAIRVVRRLKKDNEETLTEISKQVRETTKNSFRAVSHVVDEVMAELDELKRSSGGVKALSKKRAELESKVNVVFSEEKARLERLREQFNAMSGFWQEDGYDVTELTEALEEEIDVLREQRDADLELAQIGLALSVISHEFEKTVGALRHGFRRMKAWAVENPSMDELYRDLRNSFDHLDGYLTMFTPLDRRLHRTEIKITGKAIFRFLSDLFEGRMKRHNISLTATPKFKKASVRGYPSSFYPVFANLVDNSIFWLQRIRDEPRLIELDVDGKDFLVRDNGSGVSVRDRSNIFALRFSRKPAGRGMGLYISRETLAKVGYQLTLEPKTDSGGAVFRISPIEDGA